MKKTFQIKRFYDTNKKNKNQVIKKFIFSAVAMIAFVGSSMAADNVIRVQVFANNSCIDEAKFKVEEYEQVYGCLTDTQYNFMYKNFFNTCQNRNPCDLQPTGISQ